MVGGRERDGIFIGDDAIHLVECTVSRAKAKAESDCEKLFDLWDRMRKSHPDKAIKAWFVTRDEPTAEQRQVAHATKNQQRITAVGFDQFRSKLIDAKQYLDLRRAYPFGSARNPSNQADFSNLDSYVDIGLRERSSGKMFSLAQLVERVVVGGRFVVTGDFGAGKSSTLKEVFTEVASRFWKKQSNIFPVYINLRDHHGQKNPAEALGRHALNIGFEKPHHLTRAWRAGQALLILDGFDEIMGSPWTSNLRKLRDTRRMAVTLIREFIGQTPVGSGVLVAGRQHFFDSSTEMSGALGLDADFVNLCLDDFTDEQISKYLAKKGYQGAIPDWLPSRPLLLGYLLARDHLSAVADPLIPPAEGWNLLVDRICTREAAIEAGIDGEAVRSILESLATMARRTTDGLGPLSSQDIIAAFQRVVGHPPDDQGTLLLQRLPGLGVHNAAESTRAFIDQDLASTLRAGELFRYALSPHTAALLDAPSWQVGIGVVGAEVAALRLGGQSISDKNVFIAARHAGAQPNHDLAVFDLVVIADSLGAAAMDGRLYLQSIYLSEFRVPDVETVWSSIEFQNCMFGVVDFPTFDAQHSPTFKGCLIGTIEGREDSVGLEQILQKCDVERYDAGAQTSAALLALPVPVGVRVALTILRKLHVQRGGGRKLSALYRGLDPKARGLVDDILELLQQEGMAVPSSRNAGEPIWLPVRAQAARVRKLVSSNGQSNDPFLDRCAAF